MIGRRVACALMLCLPALAGGLVGPPVRAAPLGARVALTISQPQGAAVRPAATSTLRTQRRGSYARSSPKPRTGGITYSIAWLRWLQRQVDRGKAHYRFYLDPVQVTLRGMPRLGYTGSPISLVAPPHPRPAPTAHRGEDGLPETDVVVRWRGREYWVVLNQFVRPGPSGIWSIITITPM